MKNETIRKEIQEPLIREESLKLTDEEKERMLSTLISYAEEITLPISQNLKSSEQTQLRTTFL